MASKQTIRIAELKPLTDTFIKVSADLPLDEDGQPMIFIRVMNGAVPSYQRVSVDFIEIEEVKKRRTRGSGNGRKKTGIQMDPEMIEFLLTLGKPIPKGVEIPDNLKHLVSDSDSEDEDLDDEDLEELEDEDLDDEDE